MNYNDDLFEHYSYLKFLNEFKQISVYYTRVYLFAALLTIMG